MFKVGKIITASILIFAFCGFVSNAKDNKDFEESLQSLDKKNPKFETIQKAFQKHWSFYDREKPSGWKQYKRWEHFWERRLTPSGEFPKESEVYDEWKKFKSKFEKKESSTQSVEWELLGPVNTPEKISQTRKQGLGRLNVVRFNPDNTDEIWVGAASGGLWKSKDGGNSWRTFPFSQFLSIGISDIAISPKNKSVIYVATGDDNGTYGSGGGYYSVGLMRTFNGGVTWEKTSLNSELEERFVISRIIMHPDDYSKIVVATSEGIMKTTDGGNNWQTGEYGRAFKDMEYLYGSPNVLVAAAFSYTDGAAIYRSTDFGDSWTKIQQLNGASRIALAKTPADPNRLYAIATRAAYTSLHSFLVSEDGGQSWELYQHYSQSKNILGRYKGVDSDSLTGQGNYDLSIAADPVNPDIVYVGGINIWKSENEGGSFELLTHYSGWYGKEPVHADHHDLQFKPGSRTLYSANDGGLYKLEHGNRKWDYLTDGMSITQFYRLGAASSESNIILSGCQDNGTSVYYKGDWLHVLAGDGMECAVDPKDSTTFFATYYYGNLHKSTNSGVKFDNVINKYKTNEPGAWVAPFVIDSIDNRNIYIGYQNVWKSSQYGEEDSWKRASNFNGQSLQSMAIAPSDHNTIYAATYYNVYVSYDGGDNWTNIYNANRPITYISVSPNSNKRFWMSFGGFYPDTKIIEINDGKEINLTGNLPNVPVNCVIYQPNSPDRLYIGTDIGTFYSDYGSAFWESYGEGMPNVIVNELEINNKTNELIAATYGRGLWKTDLNMCNLPEPQVDLLGDSVICEGDTVMLIARSGHSNYLWSNGETGRVIEVYEDGVYSVQISDNDGCKARSKAVHITVLPTPYLRIYYSGDTPGFCEGKDVRLSASLGFDEYLWSNGEESRSIEVSEVGFYWVGAIASNGCARKTEPITVVEFPNPPNPTIEKSGNLLTAVVDFNEIADYNWYLDGDKLHDKNDDSLFALESGKYVVEIVDSNGCSATSDEYDVTVGVERKTEHSENIIVKPNPNEGVFNLEISGLTNEEIYIEVTNVLGKTVKTLEISQKDGFVSINLDISALADGVYYLNVAYSGGFAVKRIIKK